MKQRSKTIPWHLLAAAIIYGLFAAYLYQPHFRGFAPWQWLVPVNVCAGALGCFVLSRRWVSVFTGSLLAGAVYGFGPFILGLARFHPTAGLLAAAIPWLFTPAAFFRKSQSNWLGAPLSLLPFVTVLLFFRVSSAYGLFAAPIHTSLRPADLASLVAPLVMVHRSTVLIGLYHIPIAAFILGFAMMLKARRYGVLSIILLGLLLAFCRSFLGPREVAWLGVSPIMWLSIPMTCCSVLAGIGTQGLVEAGFADRKWILALGITLGALAIVTLLLATQCFQVFLSLGDGYARLFVDTAEMYLIGALAMGIVFILTRQQLRVHWLRWALLVAALGIDIFISARTIVDKIL